MAHLIAKINDANKLLVGVFMLTWLVVVCPVQAQEKMIPPRDGWVTLEEVTPGNPPAMPVETRPAQPPVPEDDFDVWLNEPIAATPALPSAPEEPARYEQPVAAPAQEDAPSDQYDFGDYSSQALTVQAWEALILEEYDVVPVYTSKCIELFEQKALEQQAALRDFAPQETALDYWALNDVATSYFIQARAKALRGDFEGAKRDMKLIMQRFAYAQAWDSRGWFWRIADAAKDQLSTIGTPYDYGDYTSQTLATKGWHSLDNKDYKGVELYAQKNIELYRDEAIKLQATLKDFAPKEHVHDYWALNDVAVSYFQLGEAYTAQKKYQQARAAYQTTIDTFPHAQVWDPKGWFWKVAVASKGRLRKIQAQEKRGW